MYNLLPRNPPLIIQVKVSGINLAKQQENQESPRLGDRQKSALVQPSVSASLLFDEGMMEEGMACQSREET